MNDTIFREQLQEDIKLLQKNLSWNTHITKDEYAFNYWVLSNIYSLDEEECSNNITEYNDKGIDCFVHYEEDKELYIIQNKYYGESTKLNSKDVSDFLTRPVASLDNGNYQKSTELQKIYNRAKEDNEYKVFLHFYVTNNIQSEDVTNLINSYGSNDFIAELFYLEDIKNKYYGESYKENATLDATLSIKVKANVLKILPEAYNSPNMSKAFYVMAKISDIYSLLDKAKKEQYPLFEKNIRDYLGGTSGINKTIINTLKDPEQRGNFFYYNNGITIICDEATADANEVNISNPQIVNGCQTVNSISEVLKRDGNANENFKDVYVMAKILVLEKSNSEFYRDIVKYTNSQNSINEKVFGATLQLFLTIQKKLEQRGFLLIVKQSDKHTFKQKYRENEAKGKLLEKANQNSKQEFHQFKKLVDVQIPLETLIQIIGAFKKDAYFAYVKKSSLLKPTSTEYYQKFSTKIGDFFTIESMVKLIIIYKKSEYDKRGSDDRRFSSPYYLLNFLGFYLESESIDRQDFLKNIIMEDLIIVYKKFEPLSKEYHKKRDMDYNKMIKERVDKHIMKEVLTEHIEGFKKHNLEEYEKFNRIFMT